MTDSIHKQCLDAIREDIVQAIPAALAFCEQAEIRVRRWPWDEREAPQKGIIIWENGEELAPETTQRENVGYRCAVTFIVRNEKNPSELIDRLPAVRELVRRRYTHERRITSLTLGTGVFPCICKVHPQFKFDPPRNASWVKAQDIDYRHLLIVAWTKENAA